MERRRDSMERKRENVRGAHAEYRATTYVELRGVGRVTRSHGVRCVKWSTIPSPPVIICILSRRYLAYQRPNRRGAARCGVTWLDASSTSSVSMAWHSDAIQPPAPVSWTCTQRTMRWSPAWQSPDAPHAWASSTHRLHHHQSLPCSSSCPVRVIRCPAWTTDPSFWSAYLGHIGHQSSIFTIDPWRANGDEIFEGEIWCESVCTVERNFIRTL